MHATLNNREAIDVDLETIKRQTFKWTQKYDSTFKLMNKRDFLDLVQKTTLL